MNEDRYQGVTFPGRRVGCTDDALMHSRMLANGIMEGCRIHAQGNVLTMDPGVLQVCGRQIRHPGAHDWVLTGSTSTVARIVLTIDTTQASTADTFQQVADQVDYAASEKGLPDLIQEDINASGSRYQMVLAVLQKLYNGEWGFLYAVPPAIPVHAVSSELLWTNPDGQYAKTFKGQNVSLNLSSYDAVMILYACDPLNSGYGDEVSTLFVPVNTQGRMRHRRNTADQRELFVNRDKVYFADCINSTFTKNNLNIPLQILGIRGFPLMRFGTTGQAGW